RRMDFETDGPSEIAAAIAEEIGREVDYTPVETDGAARAAARIAELLERATARYLAALMETSVELVRGIVDSLNRGDLDGMLANMHADFEWTPLASSPVARVYRARDPD